MELESTREMLTKLVELKDSLKITHLVTKLVRTGFVIFGVVYVLYGFAKTMQKFKAGNVLVKEEIFYPQKYVYPSITFCYKYKHRGKNIINAYFQDLFEKLKQSGKLFSTNDLIHIQNCNDFNIS